MIHGITGLNGAGKTAYAVGVLRRFHARGFDIAANIGVAGARHVRSFDDLLELRNCVLLVDEVTAVASSRAFASLTPEALLFFQTLRHSNVGLLWTAPTYDRCDIALRSLTLTWTHLSALWTIRPKGSIWRNTKVSFKRTGRPIEGIDGPKMLSPIPSLYRPARHFEHYDSFADVDLFSRQQRFPGRCPNCGVGVDYGRARPTVGYQPDGDFAAAFHCSRCGVLLGVPVVAPAPSA